MLRNEPEPAERSSIGGLESQSLKENDAGDFRFEYWLHLVAMIVARAFSDTFRQFSDFSSCML